MKYGINCDGAFGDCMFSTALCKAVAEKYGPVGVSTQTKYRDAYSNLPFVEFLTDSRDELGAAGYSVVDTTPSNYFEAIKSGNPEFSLIDTHGWAWRRAVGDDLRFNPIPQLVLTTEELRASEGLSFDTGGRLIAIESVAFSGQSWADRRAWKAILDAHTQDHILWLSNQDAPELPNINNLLHLGRRQVIAAMSRADTIYTTGSGFFCASLGLPNKIRTVCLWKDHYYKYEARFAQIGLDKNIIWAHNHDELEKAIR